MVVFLLIQKAVFWAEFTSVLPQWPAEEPSPESTAHCSATGHPLHHAEVGNTCLLRAASSTARSARKPLLCGLIINLWERATDKQLFLKNFFKCNKRCGRHCSSPAVFSTINLLQSGGASAFALLLRLACSNQLCAVLMTFNRFNTEVPGHACPTYICCAPSPPLVRLFMTNTTLAWSLISSSAINHRIIEKWFVRKYTP